MQTRTPTDRPRSRRAAVTVAVASSAWMLLVWATRARNVARSSSPSGGGRVIAFGAAALFVVLAIAALVSVLTRWVHGRVLLGFIAAFTIAWWGGRSVLIFHHAHSVAFRLVHLALAVISSVLAIAAWRVQTAPRK